ncbi:autotransporter outer membrane beta-barrel domain-containing protein [Pseudomonas sp. 6D_7.1_Bac1]|uniref:autotransporter outer membrane beta-barrel domain-containing protein n=1 Tax=Pseudomonas sp. 6D_7.1_Bac1 TaxID=2971615 RepID=UPI0021C774A5|nr:autotransporter outer membrane beta-barrel domain-containing protein [Pseudomonas sp. 6D_7.1_Bac1]MCU1750309.1 autotransporter outer membrane beta-barrel domain-containing protein [Pseudomonas sp. 6D_7.1_Bac1]
MITPFLSPKTSVKGRSEASLLLLMFIGNFAQAATLPVGGSQTIDNTYPTIESWFLNPGSTLISNGAHTLDISANTGTLVANGGSTQQLSGRIGSTFTLTGVTVGNAGPGAALLLSNSTASVNASQLTSNDIGLQLIRSNATQTGSTASLTNSSVMALNGGAFLTGFSQLNLTNSSVQASDAASYGIRLTNAGLNATGSTIIGGHNGVQVGTEAALAQASNVTLDNSSVEGKTGSAIIVGYQGRPGINVAIDVLNGSNLIGGNGNVLEVNDGSTVGLTVDRSALTGNVVVDATSNVQARFQNGASLNGNLQNVAQVILDTQSTLTGDVLAQAGSGATVRIDNASALKGNVNNVINLTLDHGSTLTGDVLADTGGAVLLDNGSTLTGRIDNSTNLGINNSAQWVMTGNSSVQNLALKDGVVRMGANDGFQQLDVVNLSGNGTFVMGTDLSNGHTDFLNVTGNASGQHQLQVSATGNEPVSAAPVKIGNVASGDASFALQNGLVDAGAFTYKLSKDGEGLFLQPDKTVSASTNTVLAIAGNGPSILYAGLTTLNSRLGDRRLNSSGGDTSSQAMSDTAVKNLSNSVWMRTYGNQYNVSNAYGGGYTQNQSGFSLGADTQTQLGGQQWLLGAFVGSSRTDMDLKNNSTATVDSLNAGIYGTLLDTQSGMYVDVVSQVNQFNNKANVTMSDGTRTKGDYKSLGLSASVEVGKHIRFDQGYFVEPYVQVAAAAIEGKHYQLDNGLQVDAEATRSLLGKVGMSVGREIVLDNGSKLQPRVRVAVGHEFVKNNAVRVNDNDFNNNLSTTSAEYGAGLNWAPAQKNWQVYAELGASKGKTIDQEWNASAGISYNF